MIKAKPSSIFTLTVIFIIFVLAVASLHFFSQMSDNYIMIQKGISPSRYVLDNHKFIQNRRALVFSSALLFSGVSFLIMILLPSREQALQQQKSALPVQQPQQPSQQPSQQSFISAPVEPAPSLQPEKTPSADEESQPVIIQEQEAEMIETPRKQEAIISSVDTIEDIKELSDDYGDSIVEGENDVVYGVGDITDSAIIDFVHKFPDSALKFLYRKNLDGTSLTYEVEGIYNDWENRGMTRSKVKSYVLTLTGWKSLPKKALREVWVDLRDAVFDMRT